MEPERMIERLAAQRLGCVRSAVLGASGGIIGGASLIVGIAAAGGAQTELLRGGAVGLVAAAMAFAACQFMAAGRQSAGTAGEGPLQGQVPAGEEIDFVAVAATFRQRGLSADLAEEAALSCAWVTPDGIPGSGSAVLSDMYCAGPLQAAFTTGLTVAAGAAVPLGFASLFRPEQVAAGVALAALACLVLLGLASARRCAVPAGQATLRLVAWGAASLALCFIVGRLLGVTLV